jgi:hypothetical protein
LELVLEWMSWWVHLIVKADPDSEASTSMWGLR